MLLLRQHNAFSLPLRRNGSLWGLLPYQYSPSMPDSANSMHKAENILSGCRIDKKEKKWYYIMYEVGNLFAKI